MGCFDSILVACPNCGEKAEFQSKGGDCLMRTYDLGTDIIPEDVLSDVNRHGPYRCPCGTTFLVERRVSYSYHARRLPCPSGVTAAARLSRQKA